MKKKTAFKACPKFSCKLFYLMYKYITVIALYCMRMKDLSINQNLYRSFFFMPFQLTFIQIKGKAKYITVNY